MITKTLDLTGIFFACCATTLFAVSITAISGCGPTKPDQSDLDRIPNVPPSSRSQGGAAIPGSSKR